MAKKRSKKKPGVFEMPELSNASKTLLANIRFASVDNPIKSFVITSSTPDEGKTTVATNLVCAIASSGKRVLLVETDMRRRSIAHRLGIHASHGIYALLTDTVKPRDAIISTDYPNLYFLDSEPGIPSPPDILSSQRFANLVKTLEDQFDYVVFDTPPVCAFVDAAVVGTVVDGVILVVREHYAKREMVSDAIQQLKAANAKILGVVMTFSNDVVHDYYYSYYNERGQGVNHNKSTLSVGKAARPRDIKEKVSKSETDLPKSEPKPVSTQRSYQTPPKEYKKPIADQNGSAMSLPKNVALNNLNHSTPAKKTATNNPRENKKRSLSESDRSLPVISDSKVKPVPLRDSRPGKH